VARLATCGPDGRPHVVPLVFVVDGDRVYSAVDHKPKRSNDLRRLANLRGNSAAALLVDHYADDWTTLWWVRADGDGRILEAHEAEARHAVGLLVERYVEYRARAPSGPVVAVDVWRWSGWAATEQT
jgi:PPOX class probable F420-dependent enzyme